MSSIKKVLCLKAKNNHDRTFITNKVYDVDVDGGCGWVKDENGYSTCILFVTPCIYGVWQPLEGYMCMTHTLHPESNIGDILYGYAKYGAINFPHEGKIVCKMPELFKKLSEINTEPKPRHEVRHVIYDTKDNKIVNDAMGECYITLAEAQEVCDEMNAPKVMKLKYTKEVEYFGMKLLVPDDAKSIASHGDGSVFVSDELLIESSCGWMASGYLKHICNVDLNGIDWKETLVEIK